MKAPRILALDLSLTATGVASNEGGGWATTIHPGDVAGIERIAWIRSRIVNDYMTGVEYAVVEGLPFGSSGAYAKETAMLYGVICHMLYARRIPTAAVNPTTLKSYAANHGGAEKNEVRGEVIARFPNFRGDHNAADALALCAMGCEHFGVTLGAYGFPNPAAVARVQWPDPIGVLNV